MVDTHQLPGTRTPGPHTPGPSLLGSRVPDQSAVATRTTEGTVAVDATGTTTLGTPSGYGGRVRLVTVDAGVADFDFTVTTDGVAVFDAPQSLNAAGTESFIVAVENGAFDGAVPQLVFEVTSASATAGEQATVTVETDIESQ